MMAFELKGSKAMGSRLLDIQRRMLQESIQALKLEAERIMGDAKKNYVPIDEGVLKNSGVVGDVEVSTTNLSVVLAFGGPAAPYALAIHEHPGPHDPPTWKGNRVEFSIGGPKYLQIPLFAAVGGMAQRIANKAKPR